MCSKASLGNLDAQQSSQQEDQQNVALLAKVQAQAQVQQAAKAATVASQGVQHQPSPP